MIKLKELLNEAYGQMKLAADLEAWAKNAGVNFKKLSSKKKPADYGGSTSDTFYQIGDKYILVRYTTVPGAPRLNELKMWILDKPDTSAKNLAGFSWINDFSNIKVNLDKIVKSKGKEATAWNKVSVEKLLKDLQKDRKYRNMNDAEAFDVANSILDDNEGLEKAIQQIYKVRDVQGWLANKI